MTKRFHHRLKAHAQPSSDSPAATEFCDINLGRKPLTRLIHPPRASRPAAPGDFGPVSAPNAGGRPCAPGEPSPPWKKHLFFKKRKQPAPCSAPRNVARPRAQRKQWKEGLRSVARAAKHAALAAGRPCPQQVPHGAKARCDRPLRCVAALACTCLPASQPRG